MTMMKVCVALLFSLLILTSLVIACRVSALPLERIKLPPGFHISVYADVPGARGLARGENGTIFVGTRRKGTVYAVVDRDGDHRADQVVTIADGLHMPVGVAYLGGSLYVSATDRILRFDDIEQRLDHPPTPVVITDRLPNDKPHGWKYLAFGPDHKLYVAVGAPCNICEPDPNRYAHLARMNRDGSQYEVVARGVRNSVGFDWDPTNHELWFTDNGRDGLGDHEPPDELNHVTSAGLHFGYPYCHAGTIPDAQFGGQHACSEYEPPALTLAPHVAALGMRFYTGRMFPEDYHNQIFIAEHGSWDRSEKIGYRISLATRDRQGQLRYSIFSEGWLQGQEAWGRPVDILAMPDGALLVSDDLAGALYRISYRAP